MIGFVVTHFNPKSLFDFTRTDEWGSVISIPILLPKIKWERRGRMRDKNMWRGWHKHRCHNENHKTSIMDKNINVFCFFDGLSKPLQQNEMLVANHRLRISTTVGCGWTSFFPLIAQAARGEEEWQRGGRGGERKSFNIALNYSFSLCSALY